jgi:hypothetical protein
VANDVPNPAPGKLITDQTTFQVSCQIPHVSAVPGIEAGECGGGKIKDALVVEAKWWPVSCRIRKAASFHFIL